MSWFRKDDKSPPPKSPVWFKVIIAVFLLYAFTRYYVTPPEERPDKDITKPTDIVEKKIDAFKSVLFVDGDDNIRSKDVKDGEGDPAFCGQEVTVRYSSSVRDGKIIDEAKESTFVLGSRDTMMALEKAALGMKKNAERLVYATGKAAYDHEKFKRTDLEPNTPVQFNITLLGAEPAYPNTAMKPRLFTTRDSAEYVAQCGDEVELKLAATKPDGTPYPLMKDINYHFTLGSSNMPLGIEEAVIGMGRGGKRTLLLPAALQLPLRKNANGAKDALLTLPGKETLIIDIERVK